MAHAPRTHAASYTIALAAVIGAALIRWAIHPALGETAIYLPFLLSVVVATWFGGFGPGLFAAVLGLAVGWFLFHGQPFVFDVKAPGEFLRLLLNAAAGVLVAFIGGRMHSARRAAEHEAVRVIETLESMSDGFMRVDPDMRLLYLNRAAERIIGKKREELLGRSEHEAIPGFTGSEADLTYRTVMREKRPIDFDTHFEPWGRWFSVRAMPMPDGGLAAYFQDITERKRGEEDLRRAKEKYETLFNSIDEGFCIIEMIFDDAGRAVDWRFLEMNPAWEEHTRLRNGVGRTIRELVPDLEEHWFEIYGRVALTGDSERFIDRSQAMEGRWFDVYAFKVGGADSRQVALLFADISAEKQVEEALRHSEERYRLVNRATNDAIWDWDLRTDEAQWNESLQRVFGHDPADVPQHLDWWAEQLHPDDRERVLANLRATLDNDEEVWTDRYRFRRADGSYARVVDRGYVSRDENSRPVRMIGSMLDESERFAAEEALRQSEEKFRTFFEKAAVGMGRVRFEDARWIDVNDTFCSMLGYSREQMLAIPWPRITHPEDVDLDLIPFQQMASGRLDNYTVEKRFIHKKGHHVWARLTLSLVRDERGRPDHEIAVIEDITERKQWEEALREADRRKDEFIAILAHELRNPLAAIRMAMAVLKRADGDAAKVKGMAGIIERQSSQLSRLVDDLLDVSRITRGVVAMRKEPVDLASIISHAAEGVRDECAAKGLGLTVSLPDEPVTINADAVRISQVLSNILNNACKFTDKGEVRLAAERHGDEAVVRVADTGRGIPQDQLPRVFDMFVQVEGESRVSGGLGIGLALAKSIVDLHDGTVEARSEPGKGSEFVVRLPVAREPLPPQKHAHSKQEAAAPPADEHHGGPQRRRILAVDDNRDALDSVATMLRMSGHEVVTAEDGIKAFQAASDHHPEIVLLDIGMPGMDGYEVARRIRSETWGRDMYLIAMTGWGQERDKQNAAEAGFDAHLTKPVEPDVLDRVLADPAHIA